MAKDLDKRTSKSGPLPKIGPSDSCGGNPAPLAGKRRHNFPEFGSYLENVRLKQAVKALLARGNWGDLVIGAGLSMSAGVVGWFLSSLIDTAIYQWPLEDFWFEADIPRVVENLTDRRSEHYRTSVHPLFSLLVATPTITIKYILGLSTFAAIKVEIATIATLFTAVYYVLLRCVCRNSLEAAVFCCLFITSATFLFWFGLPETYPWGGLSIILPILLLAYVPRWCSPIAFVAASSFSLSMTLTNWMAGLSATFLSQPLRKAVRLTIYAFAVVALLTTLQYHFYPKAGRFLYVGEERHYIEAHRKADHVPTAAAAFVVNSVVAPEIGFAKSRILFTTAHSEQSYLSFQTTRVGSGGLIGLASVFLWIGVLAMGIWGVLRCQDLARFRLALVAVLGGQFLLHLLYGAETFLYAAHYVPLLIAVAAFACRTNLRRPALVLAVLLTITGGINNALRFQEALDLLSEEASARIDQS